MLALPGAHHSTRERTALARSFDSSGEKITGKRGMFFEVLLQKSEYRVLAGTPVFPRLIDLLELIETGKVLKLLFYLFIDANIAEEILEDLTGDLVDLLLVTIAMIPDLPGDLPCFIKIIKSNFAFF